MECKGYGAGGLKYLTLGVVLKVVEVLLVSWRSMTIIDETDEDRCGE